jgi:hypothetical protein
VSLYVVVEFNQASGQPRIASYSGFGGGDIYDSYKEAQQDAASFAFHAKQDNRRETFDVAEIHLLGRRA